MFEWQKGYRMGIPTIDLQHRKVLAIISHLHSLEGANPSSAEMRGLFQELTDFIQTHFEDEERLMLQNGYPGLEEQKHEHEAFVELIHDQHSNFLRQRRIITINLLSSLWEWFTRHIVEVDKRYVPYLRPRRIA